MMVTNFTRTPADLACERERMRVLRLAYYVALRDGGYIGDVQDDMLRYGGTAFNPTGIMMTWDGLVATRTREIEQQRGIKPRLGVDLACWSDALDELIKESERPAVAEAGKAGGAAGTPEATALPVRFCQCFGGSGLHASTHGVAGSDRDHCDLCGWPVPDDSTDVLTAINSTEAA